MTGQIRKPKQALNKAYLKLKPTRDEIESFKKNLIVLIDKIDIKEGEEHAKNLVRDFLRETYYKDLFEINVKNRNDLVIHNGKTSDSDVSVIIEAKRPSENYDFPKVNNLNVKAMHELVLYYLRERIDCANSDIRHLIATNGYEWFIFDGSDFYKYFYSNSALLKEYNKWNAGQKDSASTQMFYNEIAKKYIEEIKSEIPFTYFNIKDYEKFLRNVNKEDDKNLIPLFKLLSPPHLLKLPFTNDSNSLDKNFYFELLHIIGLEEVKDGSKKIIQRKKLPDEGSLLENAINILKAEDLLYKVNNPESFGKTKDDQYFGLALELCITWMNRVLFLKLLEAQLLKYQKGDKEFKFLTYENISNYDALNKLFFQVLALNHDSRSDSVKKKFPNIPYLNSSLFEASGLESDLIRISNLEDDALIPIISKTVLKETDGKKKSGKVKTLKYLLDFLDSYDFGSEGSEDIQDERKTLINSSVLGLIFEKINGYKDGSFFTPGFITMYMCRETIRRAVIQKFNDAKGWNCADINSLYNKIEDRTEANNIINTLKICDPAVGSGHFLVSALNEIIAIKSDLKILQDHECKRLKEYHFEVVSDELIITDEDGELFEYNPTSRESQRIQETVFHEKQTIIENCLFGVDINHNSVKICRLRLWIELLKNAYYTKVSNYKELETLPNIDINIKCGNSLVSRFGLDADLSSALRKSKWTITAYRIAVQSYQNAKTKDEKRDLEKLLNEIKNNFRSEISVNDPKQKRLERLENELYEKYSSNKLLFVSLTDKEKAKEEKEKQKLVADIEKAKAEIKEIKDSAIYRNAFEWRFEFPEVLDEKGNYIGFDVVIGNPPYVYRNIDIDPLKNYLHSNYYNNDGNYDLYKYFIERSVCISRKEYFISFITNSSFILQQSFKKTREFLIKTIAINLLAPLGPNVFDEATVDSSIFIAKNTKVTDYNLKVVIPDKPINLTYSSPTIINQKRFLNNDDFVFDYLLNDSSYKLVNRLLTKFPNIEKGYEFGVGINTGYIKSELLSDKKIDSRYHLLVTGKGISRYGPVRTEGYILYDKEFVKNKGKLGRALPDEKFFTNDKILITRTRNLSLNQRIIATIDTNQKYNLNRLSNIISRHGYDLYGLLGVLNSSLFNWLYSNRFYDYEIKPIYLRNSPLCDTNNIELITLVKSILTNREEGKITLDIEREVDRLVYQLYGLTEEDIEIVERGYKRC